MFSTWNSPNPIMATQIFFSPRPVAATDVAAILDKSYDTQLKMLQE
jgi:hypothetical protein